MAQLSDKQADALQEKLDSGEWNKDTQEFKAITRWRFHDDPLLFAQYFLKDHLTNTKTGEMTASAPFHHELMELAMTERMLALAAPRGHAKSTTIGLIYAIHALLYERKRNVVIVSASEEMAKKFLRTLKDELEHNELIIHFFGEQRTEKWSESEFRMKNKALVHAKGRGGQLRGLKDGAHRPDLVILDDIEDEEVVRSEMRRSDLEDWFNGMLPGVDPATGQIIFIGTILHMESLLSRLLDKKLYPDFVSRRWAALMENDTKTLWPTRFTVEDLLDRKKAMAARGKLARFYMEYMNDPIPEEDAVFKQTYFQFFEQIPKNQRVITEIFIDLGGGSIAKSADPTAMVVMSIDEQNNIYVNDYINDTMGTDNDLVITKLFSLYLKYTPRRVVIENSPASRALEPHLNARMKEEGLYFTVDYVNPSKGSGGRRGSMSAGKYQRIAAMSSAMKLGDLKIRSWMTELMSQLMMFPRSQHDDIADAMGYGFGQLMRRTPNQGKGYFLRKKRNNDLLPFEEGYEEQAQYKEYKPLYSDIGL